MKKNSFLLFSALLFMATLALLIHSVVFADAHSLERKYAFLAGLLFLMAGRLFRNSILNLLPKQPTH